MGAGDRSAFTSASSAAFAGLDCESELILGVSSLRDCLLPALLRAWLLARWWKPPRRLYSLAAEASQKVSPPNAGSANRPPARARRPSGQHRIPPAVHCPKAERPRPVVRPISMAVSRRENGRAA